MPKISELPPTATIINSAVFPVLQNDIVQQISFANFKSAIATPATSNLPGVVKIGNGIAISSDGTISIIVPPASANTLGGVRIPTGSNLTVNSSGGLNLKEDMLFANGSRINATSPDAIAISASSIVLDSSSQVYIGVGNDFGGFASMTMSFDRTEFNGIVQAGLFDGSFQGVFDGKFIGNIYEPGTTNFNKNEILNVFQKTINLQKASVGDIIIGGMNVAFGIMPNLIYYSGEEEEFVISAGSDQKHVRINNLKSNSIESSNITSQFGLVLTAGETGNIILEAPLVGVNTDMQVNGTLTSGLFVPHTKEILGQLGLTIRSDGGPVVIESGYGGISLQGKNNAGTDTRKFIDAGYIFGFTDRPTVKLYGDVIIDNQTSSTTAGASFKLPTYTISQRDTRLMSSLNNGELIYNTTTNKVQAYADGAWVDLH